MEDNGAAAAAAAAAASATSVPAEKHVAIPAAAAVTTNGGAEEDKEAEDLPPEPALPCGPRKTGLHLFIMNIRCVSSGTRALIDRSSLS
jgi:hypothetical protein